MLAEGVTKGLTASAVVTLAEFRHCLLQVFPAAERPQLLGLAVGVAPRDSKSLALALLGKAWAQQHRKRFAAIWVPEDANEAEGFQWFTQLGRLGLVVEKAAVAIHGHQWSSARSDSLSVCSSPERHVQVRKMPVLNACKGTKDAERLHAKPETDEPGRAHPAQATAASVRGQTPSAAFAGRLPALDECSEQGASRKLPRGALWERRQQRLRILCAEALERDLGLVALGHCLDDQVSILVHRMRHGGFLDGLSALAPAQDPVDLPLRVPRIVRPFWHLSEFRLVETCRAAGLVEATGRGDTAVVAVYNASGLRAARSKETSGPSRVGSPESTRPISAETFADPAIEMFRARNAASNEPVSTTTDNCCASQGRPEATSIKPTTSSPSDVQRSPVAALMGTACSAPAPVNIEPIENARTKGAAVALSGSSRQVVAAAPAAAHPASESSVQDEHATASRHVYLAPVIKALRKHEQLLDEEADQLLLQCVEFSSPLGYLVIRPAKLAEHALTKAVGLRALLRILQYVGAHQRANRTEALERLYEDITAPATKMSGRTLMGCLLKPQNSLNRIGAFLHKVRWRQSTAGIPDQLGALQADQTFYLKQAADAHEGKDPSLQYWHEACGTHSDLAGEAGDAEHPSDVLGTATHASTPAALRKHRGRAEKSHMNARVREQHDQSRCRFVTNAADASDPASNNKLGWYPRFVVCREPASSAGRSYEWMPLGRCILWDRRFIIRIERHEASHSGTTRGKSSPQTPPDVLTGFEGSFSVEKKKQADVCEVYSLATEALRTTISTSTTGGWGAADQVGNLAPAALPPASERGKHWFRVRQMTLHDWTQVTAWRPRLKWTFVPYVCRLALPVFDDGRNLIAVPHFGFNRRPDLRFTVLFATANRTLPPELDRTVGQGIGAESLLVDENPGHGF